jgi:hypothetical protein
MNLIKFTALFCLFALNSNSVFGDLLPQSRMLANYDMKSLIESLVQMFSGLEPTYRLTYFNISGRAEFIRWIFAAGGQAYIDNRVSTADWPTLKPTTPFLQLPILEICEGSRVTTLAQSMAIGNFNFKFIF